MQWTSEPGDHDDAFKARKCVEMSDVTGGKCTMTSNRSISKCKERETSSVGQLQITDTQLKCRRLQQLPCNLIPLLLVLVQWCNIHYCGDLLFCIFYSLKGRGKVGGTH